MIVRDSAKNIAHKFSVWVWGKTISSNTHDLELLLLRFLEDTYDPDEKEPLDYKLLKASTEIYKLCKPEYDNATDEQIVKRILKIARLLRDGGN
jgi:hypothetical protein